MFIGTHIQNLDSKGRLSIPAKFREILNGNYSGKLILTHFENYIISHPSEEWLKFQEKLRAISKGEEERVFIRHLFSGASECTLDNQGRILIPPPLREHAGIQKEVAMIGIMDKIEIWSRDRFEEFRDGTKETLSKIPEKLREIGFL